MPSDKERSHFQPIPALDLPEPDYGVFDALNEILKRIGRSGQRQSQNLDLLRDSFDGVTETLKEELQGVRQRQQELESDLKAHEISLLELADIIEAMGIASTTIPDPAFTRASDVAVKTMREILVKLGFQIIPGVGSTFDSSVHYVIEAESVDSIDKDGAVLRVVQSGYRRGSKLIRKATVVCGKWREE